jgi:hypothetical protein
LVNKKTGNPKRKEHTSKEGKERAGALHNREL